MENEQILSKPLSEMDVNMVTDGVEKFVYRIEEDGRPFAMKIFKSSIPGQTTVDRDMKARNEFSAYQVLKKSSLKPFIPDPVRVVTTKLGKAIGLVVEWKDGISIENGGQITEQEIKDLEECLLRLTESGIKPSIDMYSEGNIMVGETGIWLAECEISNQSGGEDIYRESVRKTMNRIRKACEINILR